MFGADQYFTIESESVVVDDGVRARLNSLWQAQMGNPATPEQLESLVENWIREEVMFREALRLNLDRDDTIIRRRLVQKLRFLAEDVAVNPPGPADLKAFYEKHISQYSEPRRYSFSQVFFSNLASAEQKTPMVLAGDDWKSVGETSMLNHQYIAKSEREIGNIFGSRFATYANNFELDKWAGPFKSSFGYHYIRLERVDEPVALPLASIEMKVLADFQEEQKRVMLDKYFESLLERTRLVYR